jgi:hypothetical protein
LSSLADLEHRCGLFEHHDAGSVIHQEDKLELREKFNIKKFFSMMFIFGLIGWVLEASLTGFIVNYINKVKPDVLKL